MDYEKIRHCFSGSCGVCHSKPLLASSRLRPPWGGPGHTQAQACAQVLITTWFWLVCLCRDCISSSAEPFLPGNLCEDVRQLTIGGHTTTALPLFCGPNVYHRKSLVDGELLVQFNTSKWTTKLSQSLLAKVCASSSVRVEEKQSQCWAGTWSRADLPWSGHWKLCPWGMHSLH